MDFLRSYHSSVQLFTQQVGNVGGQEAGNHWWLAFGDPTCQTEKREFDVFFWGAVIRSDGSSPKISQYSVPVGMVTLPETNTAPENRPPQ